MAACPAEATPVARVQLPHAVLADGKRLSARTVDVRLTTQRPAPVPGTTADAACWMQFFRNGQMLGRELATIVPAADLPSIAKGPVPTRNHARVDRLAGDDYYRIWINHENTHYLINLPAAEEDEAP